MIPLVPLDAVTWVGSRLARPECVLATRHGDIYCADRRGGVSHLVPGGGHHLYCGATLDLPGPLHPNGIALDRDGTFIVTHLGEDEGGVYRLTRDGRLTPILQALDGEALPAVNFVLIDAMGRLWVTVSTRQRPRMKAFRPGVTDGFIILIAEGTARIVADGFGFTNELRLSADGRILTVAETYARRLTQFDVAADGKLSNRRVLTEFGAAEFPDGIALDDEGGVWVTLLGANALVRIDGHGARQTLLADGDGAASIRIEAAYRSGTMGTAELRPPPNARLRSISSIAFAGPDLRTVHLGVLGGTALPTFTSPIPGAPMTHWLY